MFEDDEAAGTGSAQPCIGSWQANADAYALAQIAERRAMVLASMARYAKLIRQPRRRKEGLQLLPQIMQQVEGLYTAEEPLLASGARAEAQRAARHTVLRDLRASIAQLAANGGACAEFDVVHAMDALLHEWVVSGRTGTPRAVAFS